MTDSRADREATFVAKAIAIYGERYDYSGIDFVDSKTSIILNCDLHGDFNTRPAGHLNGQHCRKCKSIENAEANNANITEKFIKKARAVHGDLYDYSKVGEKDTKGRSPFICKVHGEFWQFRQNHLQGRGCLKCSSLKRTTTVEEFIERSRVTHGDTFDYSKVEQFVTTRDKVLIVCPIHGDFEQAARDHMRGIGCAKCAIDRTKTTFESFVENAKIVHEGRYDYVKESWRLKDGFVDVICPDHGVYSQNSYNHSIGMGCPKCKSIISKPEIEIFEKLSGAISETIVQSNRTVIKPKELDIWIPSLNLALEFNGIAYHDKALWVKSLTTPIQSKEKDKTDLCSNKGIVLLHIWEDDYKQDKDWWINTCLEAIGYARSNDKESLDSLITSMNSKALVNIPTVTGQLSFSNRAQMSFKQKAYKQIQKWTEKNGLIYEEVDFSFGKVLRFNETISICVDPKAKNSKELRDAQTAESLLGHSLYFVYPWDQDLSKILKHFDSKLKSFDRSFAAKRLTLTTIDNKVADSFVRSFHIQSSARGSGKVSIGLTLPETGELLAVMQLSRYRFGGARGKGSVKSSNVWEGLRLCFKDGVKIHGATTRMQKYFESHWNPEKMISYVSASHSTGTYKKIQGFELIDNKNKDAYYWVLDGKPKSVKIVDNKGNVRKPDLNKCASTPWINPAVIAGSFGKGVGNLFFGGKLGSREELRAQKENGILTDSTAILKAIGYKKQYTPGQQRWEKTFLL